MAGGRKRDEGHFWGPSDCCPAPLAATSEDQFDSGDKRSGSKGGPVTIAVVCPDIWDRGVAAANQAGGHWLRLPTATFDAGLSSYRDRR